MILITPCNLQYGSHRIPPVINKFKETALLQRCTSTSLRYQPHRSWFYLQ